MSSSKGKGKARALDPEELAPFACSSSNARGPSPSSSKQDLSNLSLASSSATASTSLGSSTSVAPATGTSQQEILESAQHQLITSARAVFERATQFFADDNFEQLYSCLFAANDLESMLACRMFLSAHAKMYAVRKRDIVRPEQSSVPSLNNTGPTRSFTALLCLEAQLQHFVPQHHILFPTDEHIKSMFECHCFMLSSLIFVLISQATGTSPSTRNKPSPGSLLPGEVRTTVALLRAQLKAVSSLLYYHYDLVHSNTSASLVRSACSKFIKFWTPFRTKFTAQFQKLDRQNGTRSNQQQQQTKDLILERRLDAIQDLTVHLCLGMDAGVDVVRFGGAKYRGAASRAKADVRSYILSDQGGFGKKDNLACGIGCLNCGRTTMILEEATKFKLCGSCGIASFCNPVCAKGSWSEHKRLCTGRQMVSEKGKGKDG